MTERIVVTGAAGFVGSHVTARLLDAGYDVRGLDNFAPTYARAHKERALAPLQARSGFTFVEGDLGDRASVRAVLGGVAGVVHAAGRAGVRSSVTEPAGVARANVATTAALLSGMATAGVTRLVHLSSSSVYGEARPPFREAARWLRPASPYAASKRAGERLVAMAARRPAWSVACLRLFSVYGPGQRPDQAAVRFAERLAGGHAAIQYGDGRAVRDFTFVGDVADAIVRAVRWTGAQRGLQTLNVGSGRPVTVATFRARLAAALGAVDRVEHAPPAPGDVPATAADGGLTAQVLGWTARTGLDDGLAAFAHWFEVTHGRSAGTTARSGA